MKKFSKTLFILSLIVFCPSVRAQTVLFDFDNAPAMTSLPIDLTVGGITAHFTATGQGYSIQEANVLGFTPAGFAGRIIYPNSIDLSDLLVSYDQTLSDFSIMYSCQELGCDDAATMRVTAYMNGNWVGTNTKVASHPGTWPVDTLKCSFPQGFNSVVVHYDSHPPTCQDYGVIYMADNMRVTIAGGAGIQDPIRIVQGSVYPNPVSQSASITFSLLQADDISITLFDITGRIVKDLFQGQVNAGEHKINWDVNAEGIKDGIYFIKLQCKDFSRSVKLVVTH